MAIEKLNKVVPEKMDSMSIADSKKVRIYPTFTIDEIDLPEIKDWEVGGKYNLIMQVEQLSMRKGSDWQGSTNPEDKKMHATFKIVAIGVEEPDDVPYGQEYAQRMGGKK